MRSEALCAAASTESLPLGSQIVENPSDRYAKTVQQESAQMFIGTFDLYCTTNLEPQGFQKGRGPFVELRRSAAAPSNFFPAARHGASLRS